jgi:hypothetical protein
VRFRTARGGEFAVNRLQFLAHHRVELHPVAEDGEIFLDLERQFLELIANLVAAQRGQAVEAQVEDGADLKLGKLIAVALNLGLDRLDQLDIGRDFGDRPLRAPSKRRVRLAGRMTRG